MVPSQPLIGRERGQRITRLLTVDFKEQWRDILDGLGRPLPVALLRSDEGPKIGVSRLIGSYASGGYVALGPIKVREDLGGSGAVFSLRSLLIMSDLLVQPAAQK